MFKGPQKPKVIFPTIFFKKMANLKKSSQLLAYRLRILWGQNFNLGLIVSVSQNVSLPKEQKFSDKNSC